MKKRSWIFKVISAFLVLFLLWILLAPLLAENLIVEKNLEQADAILVLGGSSTYIERTQKASEVYKSGVARKILLTDDGGRGGWNKKEQRNPPFVELAKWELIAQGVPAENIEILEPQVTGTIYEARVLAQKAKADNLKNILIVTSAYHTRRSLRTFEKVFADENIETNFGIVSPATGIQTPPPQIWWTQFSGWQFVAGEYLKGFYYWLFY